MFESLVQRGLGIYLGGAYVPLRSKASECSWGSSIVPPFPVQCGRAALSSSPWASLNPLCPQDLCLLSEMSYHDRRCITWYVEKPETAHSYSAGWSAIALAHEGVEDQGVIRREETGNFRYLYSPSFGTNYNVPSRSTQNSQWKTPVTMYGRLVMIS